MTPPDDPFVVLGLAPTTDLAAIKRAYFAALKLHPPHQDPDGFRRLRAAYEALQSSQKRAALALGGDFDAKAALAPLEARYGEAIARAHARTDLPEDDDRSKVEAFVSALSRLPLRAAIERVRAGG